MKKNFVSLILRLLLLVCLIVASFIPCSAQQGKRINTRGLPRTTNPLFPVEENGKWGYIDITGKIVIKPQFDEADFYQDGLARVYTKGKRGYIDKTGKIVINLPALPEGSMTGFFSEGLASLCIASGVKVNNHIKYRCGYINKMGQTVIKPQFDRARSFSGGLAGVQIDGLWVYINKSGKIVIKSGSGNSFFGSFFSEGLAVVEVEGKWGYIDKTRKIVITPQYEHAFPFSEGLAAIFINGRIGYIDRDGKTVIAPQFSNTGGPMLAPESDPTRVSINEEKEWLFFSEGLAVVPVGDKWGYIDKTGRIVIKPQFDAAHPFTEGLALVEISPPYESGRYYSRRLIIGYIDKTGKYIWKRQN